jgi:hypothetical protein
VRPLRIMERCHESYEVRMILEFEVVKGVGILEIDRPDSSTKGATP